MSWAALGLPFLLSAGVAAAQVSGLPAPMSGDCVTSATGTVTCTKSNGVALANSATTDTTNAANITSGTLPVAQVPALTGAKLPAGAPGTLLGFNAAGVQAPAVTQPYAATAGPIKVAPFSVSALSAAGTMIGPASGATSYRLANITNGARLLTTGSVTQVKTYLGTLTDLSALYFELWRVNGSGTFNLVCRSSNLLSLATANATNTLVLPTACKAQAGDYPAMYAVGAFTGTTPFSSSTAYTAALYPSYAVAGAGMTSTEDFLNISYSLSGVAYAAVQNAPIEVYLAKGPVVVAMGDSKTQGIPYSGNYLQAYGNYSFPAPAQTNYSATAQGTSLIDLSNQPVAYVSRTLGYTYANLGVTGSTSTTQLAQELPTALALKPAVLVIGGTINDSSASIATNTSVANYTSMYNQAIAAGVQKVVMTGVEPAGSVTEAVWSNTTYGPDALNAALKTFCQAQTACTWIGDQVMAALGQYRYGGTAGSLHNIQPSFAAADNLHFNNYGAQTMGLLEANAIEPPTVVGTAIAVSNAFGTATRTRATVAATHDGSLGWRWQDTRDFLQMDPQGMDGSAGTANAALGAALPGQFTFGCLVFSAGKANVKCDGLLNWSPYTSTLTAPNLQVSGSATIGTITNTPQITGAVNFNDNNAGANITNMINGATNGYAGINNWLTGGSDYYNVGIYGPGSTGFASNWEVFDQQLAKSMYTATKDGRVCLYGSHAQGVTAFAGSTAANGCPVGSGLILYPAGPAAFAGQVVAPVVSGTSTTLTSATTALPTNAQVITVNLAAAYAPTWAAPVGTPVVSLRLCQNSTGGFAFTPASNMKGFTGATTTANQCTRWQAQYFSDTATWEAMGAGVSY